MKAIALGTLVAAMCSVPIIVSAQKPIKEELIHVDSGPPPSTAAAMASAAAAIVVGKYTGAARLIETRASDDPRLPPLRSTAYTFQIVDIVKLHQYLPFAGGNLDLELPGGDKEFPAHILRERDRDTDLLKPNHTYVLFLGWNWYRNELVLAFGASGVYDITDGRLVALHSHGRHYNGTLATAFLAGLRAAAK